MKRPKVLEADIHYFKVGGVAWLAIIGKKEGKPYEIFTGKLLTPEEEFESVDGVYLPKSITSGTIEKVKEKGSQSTYVLHCKNKVGVKLSIEGLEQVFNPFLWNYSRLIAGMLRYEMNLCDIIRVVEGMNESDDLLSSWKKGVIKSLSKYKLSNTLDTPGISPQEGMEILEGKYLPM